MMLNTSQFQNRVLPIATVLPKLKIYLPLAIGVLLVSCSNPGKKEKFTDFEKGTFGYDYQFLKEYYNDLILLKGDDSAMLLVSPEVQGRVMTSTANGMEGQSFGWINYELIKSGEVKAQMNAVGGEERFWLGPEGGQFTYFFKPGKPFTIENWSVPREIDTEPFDVVSTTSDQVTFSKEMNLVNYIENSLNIEVERTISLLDSDHQSTYLNIQIPESIHTIGMESENTITNKGEQTWDKTYGMPSIWILSMLNPTPETIIILPFKPGPEETLGPIVNDVYFGKVSADRLLIKDSVVYFKGDGLKRGKIGISPVRAKPVVGSFDAINNVLTIAQFTLPAGETDYVNSLWELQEDPFSGDAVNAYNDGPMEDGSMLGPFYELESSSPAAYLASGESLTHTHRTYHFTGDFNALNTIAKTLLGADLFQVKAMF